jgi:hypothetical protein
MDRIEKLAKAAEEAPGDPLLRMECLDEAGHQVAHAVLSTLQAANELFCDLCDKDVSGRLTDGERQAMGQRFGCDPEGITGVPWGLLVWDLRHDNCGDEEYCAEFPDAQEDAHWWVFCSVRCAQRFLEGPAF